MEMPPPPQALLEPYVEPDAPVRFLPFLREGRVDDAATEYARYVLEVRDSFQLCNGRLEALRQWWLEGDKNVQ